MLSFYDPLNPPVERNSTPNTTQQANIHHWTGQARAFEFMLVQVLAFHSISIQKSSVCIWFSNRAFRNYISNFEPSLKKEARNKICWHSYNWTLCALYFKNNGSLTNIEFEFVSVIVTRYFGNVRGISAMAFEQNRAQQRTTHTVFFK